MKRVEDNSYLERRGRVWWYNRRVPNRFKHLDTRKRIKQSLSTTSIEQARYKRDLLRRRRRQLLGLARARRP
ncbi:DUF6538 domain-containing protein [Henriciella aquimarina]|uniref:DUF6538 domain-containing protein n=1 Tax=Henriciella aquimarina TaxID=545261 RepID=UPI001F1FFCE2|nr:DUF6538 domain-containing protein [Henriciella aquimarina]